MRRLTVVPVSTPDPAEKLRQRIKRMPKPPETLQCRCGCRELVQVKSGVMFKDGKATGGTPALLCAACLARGERVVVL